MFDEAYRVFERPVRSSWGHFGHPIFTVQHKVTGLSRSYFGWTDNHPRSWRPPSAC